MAYFSYDSMMTIFFFAFSQLLCLLFVFRTHCQLMYNKVLVYSLYFHCMTDDNRNKNISKRNSEECRRNFFGFPETKGTYLYK